MKKVFLILLIGIVGTSYALSLENSGTTTNKEINNETVIKLDPNDFVFLNNSSIRLSDLINKKLNASFNPSVIEGNFKENIEFDKLFDPFSFISNDLVSKLYSSMPTDSELTNDRILTENNQVDFNAYEDIKGIIKEQDTLVLGGVLPFYGLPDRDEQNYQSSFEKDKLSFFLYFKQKF